MSEEDAWSKEEIVKDVAKGFIAWRAGRWQRAGALASTWHTTCQCLREGRGTMATVTASTS